MQKMNFIPQIVFEILKFKKSCNLIGREHFGLFSPDMQILQNHIAIYGTPFKAQRVMLPPLKCQLFYKIWLCHVLVYMAKYPHAKN